MKYEFIYKTIFFPEKGILAVGDLHLGFEKMLEEAGISPPEKQVSGIISDLKKVFNGLIKRKHNLKKIVFLGDIKHFFTKESKEKDELKEIVDFLKKNIDEKNIIFIKGNHDIQKNLGGITPKTYHIEEDVIFTHGHQQILETSDKKIKIIVFGHLHPSLMLKEKSSEKIEFYKCFLEGKYNGKIFLVVPSFMRVIEGTLINNYEEDYIESFSIIPKKDIMNSRVYIVGENKAYEFGRINELLS